MTKKNNQLLFFSIILLLGVSILYIYVGLFSHPYADDFSFTDITHKTWMNSKSLLSVLKDSLKVTLESYQNWQGSFCSVFLFTLNPIVFDYGLYFLSSTLLILLFCFSNMLFIYKLLCRFFSLNTARAFTIACFIVSLQLIFNYSPYEYFYNYVSGSYYNLFQSLCLIAFSLMLINEQNRRWYLHIIIFLLFLFIGGGNYITAIFAFCVLALLLIHYLYKRSVLDFFIILLYFAALCFTLYISMSAPGNAARQNLMGAALPLHPMKAILLSIIEAIKIFIKMMDIKIIVFLMLIGIAGSINISSKLHPLLLLVLSILLLAAQFTPIIYAQGNTGPDRIISLIYSNTITLFYINLLYTFVYLRSRYALTIHKIAVPLVVIGILLSAIILPKLNVIHMIRDIYDGSLTEYHRQKMLRHYMLENTESNAASVKKITAIPRSLEVGELTDSPSWINDSIARYYEIDKIYLDND